MGWIMDYHSGELTTVDHMVVPGCSHLSGGLAQFGHIGGSSELVIHRDGGNLKIDRPQWWRFYKG